MLCQTLKVVSSRVGLEAYIPAGTNVLSEKHGLPKDAIKDSFPGPGGHELSSPAKHGPPQANHALTSLRQILSSFHGWNLGYAVQRWGNRLCSPKQREKSPVRAQQGR